MASSSLRFEDRLEGDANFSAWKERVAIVLMANSLWELVENEIQVPSDPRQAAECNLKDVKARGIILDAVKDHIIPHISGKHTAHQMWSALMNLYQSNNENRKMVLRKKLRNIRMNKSESVASYFTRIKQVHNELSAVGEAVDESEIVKIALNGCTKQWDTFVTCIFAREKLPDWTRLWVDFTQKEIRESLISGGQHRDGGGDEELALAGQAEKSKGKSKQNQSGGGSSQGEGEKKDMSKVKCFTCHKYGHYFGQCPNKKKGKRKTSTTASTQMDELSEKFEEFALVSCLSAP